MRKTRKVRHYTRQGKPVSGYHAGYTPSQSWSQHVGAVLAGHKKGNVKVAVVCGVGLSLGSALFALLHVALTTTEIVILLASVGAALVGLGAARKRRRRKYRNPPVTLSLKARKHHMLAKLSKAKPANLYRSARTRARNRFPMTTGAYDRWLGTYEVTISTGRGKTRKTETIRVRGVVNRETAIRQERERFRQKYQNSGLKPPPFTISNRQVFR